MHSAILAIELPPDNYTETNRWKSFRVPVSKLDSNPAVKEISPAVWQIDFQQSSDALAELIVACENFGYNYGILQFDDEPRWLHREAKRQIAKTG
jgi:hypothetical protein